MNELSVADEVNIALKRLTDAGVDYDRAISILHRSEVAFKRDTIRKNDVDPCDAERNEKLAWIDGEARKLQSKGMSANAAIDAAMRNWSAQNNSPGQR
jgi:hypothetical protein